VPFERCDRLVSHIWAARCQLGVHRIAEVLCALDSVCEIRDACQIAAAAVTGWNRAKRPVGFTDNVKPAAKSAGSRGVQGEVAGIFHCAVAYFFLVKRARPLQHHLRDLTFAFADIDPQPCRNVRRLLHGKSSGRAQQGDHGDETDDCWKERSQLQRINSPVDALQLARWLRRPNPDNVDGPRPLQICRSPLVYFSRYSPGVKSGHLAHAGPPSTRWCPGFKLNPCSLVIAPVESLGWRRQSQAETLKPSFSHG